MMVEHRYLKVFLLLSSYLVIGLGIYIVTQHFCKQKYSQKVQEAMCLVKVSVCDNVGNPIAFPSAKISGSTRSSIGNQYGEIILMAPKHALISFQLPVRYPYYKARDVIVPDSSTWTTKVKAYRAFIEPSKLRPR